MNDLIFKLNLKESTQQYCLIETYLGHLKSLKKRTFSGPLKPVDALQLDCAENLSNVLLKKIRDFFRDESRQIKKNKYLLSFSSFIKFLSLINGTKAAYCTSHDRSLYELDGLRSAKLKIDTGSISNSQDRLCLDVSDGKNFYLNNKIYCCSICGKTFIFNDNYLYLIEQNVDASILKGFLMSNQSKFSESDFNRICYKTKELEKKVKEISDLHPIPVLYVTFADVSISGKLFFSYNGYEVPSNSSEERIRDDQNGAFYLRSLIDEKRALSQIKVSGWKQSTGNSFVLCDNSITERSLSELSENHFEILTFDHKKIHPAKNASFNISYGVDWFELKVTTLEKESKRDLTHFINLKSRKRYIELEDELILLPDSIWENRQIFKQSDNQLTIAKNHIGQISEILEQPSVTSTFNPDEIIDYNDTNLLLPPRLDVILRPYQKDGIRWLLYLYKNNLGGCLADDMGLGKTIQAIAFMVSRYLEEKQPTRILVVVPKTLIQNWKMEFRKFGDGVCVSIYHGTTRESTLREFEQSGGVLLTTYNTLLNDIEILNALSFHCMFIDEAQYIKNYRAKVSKEILRRKGSLMSKLEMRILKSLLINYSIMKKKS